MYEQTTRREKKEKEGKGEGEGEGERKEEAHKETWVESHSKNCSKRSQERRNYNECVIIVIYDLCVSDHIMLDCILGGLSLLWI